VASVESKPLLAYLDCVRGGRRQASLTSAHGELTEVGGGEPHPERLVARFEDATIGQGADVDRVETDAVDELRDHPTGLLVIGGVPQRATLTLVGGVLLELVITDVVEGFHQARAPEM